MVGYTASSSYKVLFCTVHKMSWGIHYPLPAFTSGKLLQVLTAVGFSLGDVAVMFSPLVYFQAPTVSCIRLAIPEHLAG